MQSSVFGYIDYRRFLADHYREQKLASKRFSYRWFAKQAGIASPSFLKFVIDGKRNLTSPMIEKFCRAMRLDARDAKYFSHLVGFNQAKTAREKQDHYAVLRSLGAPAQEEVIRGRAIRYFERWHTPVIRELVCMGRFGDDWESLGLAVSPPIAPADARAAVAILLELGLIEKRGDGSYRQTKKGLAADENLASMPVRAFHGTMLEHAKRALHGFGKHERHQSSMVMGLSRDGYAVLVEEIRAFKDRIKILVHNDDGSSRVYHFSLDLFPMSGELPPEGKAA
jgi:uncharacterized protein (TIGR02147 family)